MKSIRFLETSSPQNLTARIQCIDYFTGAKLNQFKERNSFRPTVIQNERHRGKSMFLEDYIWCPHTEMGTSKDCNYKSIRIIVRLLVLREKLQLYSMHSRLMQFVCVG